jgi:cycloeucalenol cycloisomerase
MAGLRIEIVMILIFVGILIVIGFLIALQSKKSNVKQSFQILPSVQNPAKREFEQWALGYTVCWIGIFAVVIVTQAYEKFTEFSYLYLCVGLALPLLLQPIVFPLRTERSLPLFQRYSFKANVWIFIFSFIGNYWYTHYFYSVLKAKYTFPSHRLNDVPIALFFATHFYFVTYHTFSNVFLRMVETRYQRNLLRCVLFWVTILAFSYFTAFMETLTISSFPYYSFADRFMAYTLGSAFYGIYFIVSFPVFYRLDEKDATVSDSSAYSKALESKDTLSKEYAKCKVYSLYDTVMESMGTGMIVLLLLDFCRLLCNIPLNIGGVAYYVYHRRVVDLGKLVV